MSESGSLQWNCEQLLIQLLQADARLAGIPVVEFDQAGPASVDTIVVNVFVGKKYLDGDQGHEVSAEISYASGAATQATMDTVAAVMTEAIYPKQIPPLNINDLIHFSIEPDWEISRPNTQKLRRITLRVPILAATPATSVLANV